MASHSEPVSVPTVKPDPTASEPAPALAAPAPGAAKAGWLNGKTKVGIVLGGSVLTLVGGVFGVKSIGSGTPKAVAQAPDNKNQFITPAPVVAPPKPDEPLKLPNNLNELPVVEAPKFRPADPDKRQPPVKDPLEIDLPDMKAPPISPPIDPLRIESPNAKVPAKPTMIEDVAEPPLPAVNVNRTVKQDQVPIIRVGAQEVKDNTPPPSPPKIPIIDIEAPTIVAPPKVGGAPAPLKVDIEIPPPPVVNPPVNPPVAPPVNPPVNPPVVPVMPPTGPAPAPKGLDITPPAPPVPPIKEEVPVLSPVTISPPSPKPMGNTEPKPVVPSDLISPPAPPVPPVNVTEPRPKPPVVETPPPSGIRLEPTPPAGGLPKPPLEAVKREEYDEDWHTPKAGDNYAMISKEYYKTADYAQALEAYNKDRRKGGNENIVRVPPLWVLEEKFPSMTGSGKTDPRPVAGTPVKNPGLSFDPVEGRPIGTSTGNIARPAPAPAPAISPVSNQNDEYRVQAESGETIREIARKLYGDPNLWKRLWDTNPTVDPTQPIPTGTTLRLPR